MTDVNEGTKVPVDNVVWRKADTMRYTGVRAGLVGLAVALVATWSTGVAAAGPVTTKVAARGRCIAASGYLWLHGKRHAVGTSPWVGHCGR